MNQSINLRSSKLHLQLALKFIRLKDLIMNAYEIHSTQSISPCKKEADSTNTKLCK